MREPTIIQRRLGALRAVFSGQDWLSKMPAIAATLTVATLATAISFEWGYFNRVGVQFQALLSPTDYLTNSLSWLPTVSLLLTVIFLLAVSMPFSLAIVGQGLHGAERRAANDRAARRIAILASGVLAFWVLLLAIWQSAPMIFISFVMLLLVGLSIAISSRWIDLRSATRGLGVVMLLMVMAMLAVWGDFYADWDLGRTAPVYTVTSKSGDVRHVIVLRMIEKGMLYRDPASKRISFERWDDLRTVSRIEPDSFLNWICGWVQSSCNPPLRQY